MDSASAQSLIGVLQGIRSRLAQSLEAAHNLERKFVGPRPENKAIGNAPPQVESVRLIVGEIEGMSIELSKWMEDQHSMVGSHDSPGLAPQVRAYA